MRRLYYLTNKGFDICLAFRSYLVVIHGPRRPAQPGRGGGGGRHRGGGGGRGSRGGGGVVEVGGGHGGRVGGAVGRCRRRRVVVRCRSGGRRLQVVRPGGGTCVTSGEFQTFRYTWKS